MRIVVANEPREPPRLRDAAPRRMTLFSDATMVGWGGVLIDDGTNEVLVAGSRWENAPPHINAAELRAATCAITAFKERLLPGSHLTLKIDNTSALSAARKERAKSGAINAELAQFFGALNGVTFDAEYVKSELNDADYYSRTLGAGNDAAVLLG